MSNDADAMDRRDEASAAGAQICPRCEGSGELEIVNDVERSISVHRCPQCAGETWVDAQGAPYKID